MQEINIDDAHMEEETMIVESSNPPVDTNPLGMSTNPPFKMNPLGISSKPPLKDSDNIFFKMEGNTLHNFLEDKFLS